MSRHGKLRENKRCENCSHFVEKRFCPECGQENIETRQRFHYLFTHFFEDFVHYDSRFWRTILYLLFRPAKLTREYLAGKRNRYVPPVTLYIFISCITFFIPAILPERDSKEKNNTQQEIKADVQEETGNKDTNSTQFENQKDNNGKLVIKADKGLNINGKKISFDQEKLKERMKHDFPKAVFFYMPVFAFWLWLFHSKKKWYYFDHGIYTLHYFSFTLLSILLFLIINWFLSFFHLEIGFAKKLISYVIFGYPVYYFFHSHRLIFKESKAISRLKCSFLLFINWFCILIFLILYIIIEAIISNHNLYNEIMNLNN